MKRLLFKLLILSGMLIGLPLIGVFMAGYPIDRYLEFPPESRYVRHAAFSWIVFLAYTVFIASTVLPLVIKGLRGMGTPRRTQKQVVRCFPWWGWLGLITGSIAWVLAWTRFSWFSTVQPHTFTPLWLSLILVINALVHRRTGRSMMVNRTGFFLILFPFSALFWWFFEFLNRFAQNWYYLGAQFGPWEYFWYATLPFSTVLPAVLSVQEWMGGFGWLQSRFQEVFPIKISHPKRIAGVSLAASGLGLAGIGIWPNTFFPLLWVSPLIIVVSLQALREEPHVLSDISFGNWETVVSAALAALFCGFFWETWNYYSLAKWKYAVPFVHRFQIFEMPILGYAGYLPFGLECVVVGKLLDSLSIFSKTCPRSA